MKNEKDMESLHKHMTYEQCKHEEDQAFFTSELHNLELDLESNKKEKEEQVKKFKDILNTIKTTGGTENLNSTPILEKLTSKYSNKVSDLKKRIDSYKTKINLIEEAFEQIKQSSNITDLDEIADTFVKSEYQNHQLIHYLQLINVDIDHLEDTNSSQDKKVAE